MDKQNIESKLYHWMAHRIERKVEKGESDFRAYPVLGVIAVAATLGLNEGRRFYESFDKSVVNSLATQGKPAEIFSWRYDNGSGLTDSPDRVRLLSTDEIPQPEFNVRRYGSDAIRVVRATAASTETN